MSEQKRSIDGLKDQQTNTDEVKGGYNPNNLKPTQNRTRDAHEPNNGRDEAKPLGGQGRVHKDRNFRK